MRVLIAVSGVLAAALRVLWLLQGLGLLHMRPVLWVADCAEVQGASPKWAVIGAVRILLGGCGIGYGLFRRRRR